METGTEDRRQEQEKYAGDRRQGPGGHEQTLSLSTQVQGLCLLPCSTQPGVPKFEASAMLKPWLKPEW